MFIRLASQTAPSPLWNYQFDWIPVLIAVAVALVIGLVVLLMGRRFERSILPIFIAVLVVLAIPIGTAMVAFKFGETQSVKEFMLTNFHSPITDVQARQLVHPEQWQFVRVHVGAEVRSVYFESGQHGSTLMDYQSLTPVRTTGPGMPPIQKQQAPVTGKTPAPMPPIPGAPKQ